MHHRICEKGKIMNETKKNQKLGKSLAMLALATGTVAMGTVVNIDTSQYAGLNVSIGRAAQAKTPPKLTESIEAATSSIEALRDLATLCLTVALVPLGSMLSLKFLNMVMSRV